MTDTQLEIARRIEKERDHAIDELHQLRQRCGKLAEQFKDATRIGDISHIGDELSDIANG